MAFTQSILAPQPRTKNSATVALLLAGILVIMAVGQLFSFEKFIPLIESYWLPGGHGTAVVVASLLVTAEVFALPFLLRMRLSTLMRIVSMVAGWLVVAGWLKLAIWANVAANALSNIGFFGVHVMLPVGWWAVLFTLALGVLFVWAAWGLWPLKQSQKNKE